MAFDPLVQIGTPARRGKPSWLKVPMPGGGRYNQVRGTLRQLSLHTVCEEASCPNIGECWAGGTMTVMVLGDTCTRGCRFCDVTTSATPPAPDPNEPAHVAGAVATLGLDYLVLTMVNRDDLPDGGAAHVAEVIRGVKESDPNVLVEALVGDFQGDLLAVSEVLGARPDVFAHNVEVVERLQRSVRDARCSWGRSIDVLEAAKRLDPNGYTKSSLMLGVGETEQEVRDALRALADAGVDIVTLGQYLRPSPRHLPVARWVHPDEFESWRVEGERLGFAFVASGPLVRSSYKAGELFVRNILKSRTESNREHPEKDLPRDQETEAERSQRHGRNG